MQKSYKKGISITLKNKSDFSLMSIIFVDYSESIEFSRIYDFYTKKKFYNNNILIFYALNIMWMIFILYFILILHLRLTTISTEISL